MKRIFLLIACISTLAAQASWLWPFGAKDEKAEKVRISELVQPASELMDKASDFAEDGKVSEAVAEYKKALKELDRLEFENPDRAESAEFATVRNKRAYINASIDSLLLKQAQDNAKAVAVTDTRELELKYARLKGKAVPESEAEKKAAKGREEVAAADAAAKGVEPSAETKALLEKDPKSRRARLMKAAEELGAKKYDAAKATVRELLAEKPNDAAALNLRAAIETEQGDFKAAERTLDQSIQSNPRSYYAYYNMARLFLQTRGADGKDAAKRYYQTGRDYGGPADKELEEAFE